MSAAACAALGAYSSAAIAGGQNVYVLSQDAGVLSVIDTRADDIVARVEVGGKPASFAVDRTSRRAFVTKPEAGEIVVVDLDRLAISADWKVPNQPFGVAVGLDGHVYASDWSGNFVSAIDANRGVVTGTVPVGRSPAHVALTPDGARIFVANRESNSVSVIDARRMVSIGEIAVGRAPFALASGHDGKHVFVANVQSATVSVIDAASLQVVATRSTGAMPYGVAILEDDSEILVSNQQGNSVSIVDGQDETRLGTIKVGRYPEGIAVLDGDAKAYVANWFSSTVSVIDLKTKKEIKRIKCPDGPRMVQSGPRH